MKYVISGVVELGKGDTSIPIDGARFKSIEAARNICLLGWEAEEKLSLVLENFYEFEIELLKLAEELVIWGSSAFLDTMQRRLLLDRRLVNLLTACRLYLDQTEHIISSVFTTDDKPLASIKLFKNKLYDSHWGYRLMEALRNHAQHAGLIVHAVAHNFRHHYRKDNGRRVLKGAKTECTVIPESSVRFLAQNPNFKASVMNELKAQNIASIDLRGPIRDYISCLTMVHSEVRSLLNAPAEKARTTYEQAIAELLQREGVSLLFPTLEEIDDSGIINRVPLVTDFFQAWDALLQRHSVLNNLQWEFASNQANE